MIRPTLPEDTEALVAVAAGTGVFKPLEIDTLRDVLDGYHDGEEEGHRAITYEAEGRPVGLAYYAPTPMTERTWHLYWIFVEKSAQARGLGKKLLAHVEEDIRNSGGRLLVVETSGLPHYDATRRFYLKTNYTEAAQVPDFYADGDSMVVFTKRL